MMQKCEKEPKGRKAVSIEVEELGKGDKSSPMNSFTENTSRSRESKIQVTDFSSLKVPFPWRLWQLLEDSEKNGTQSIVSWLPDGGGFSIYNPQDFTTSIMKVYFALASYDSFLYELQRYGFTLTTKVCGPNRVDIFRNVRYNRNDRTKSLALRRKSTTRTLSDRLSAKKQQSVTDLQHKYKSCLHDPQPYHNEMPHPLSPSPFQCTGNNQSIHVTDDNLYRTTEIDAFCPTPFPISYAFPFPNPVGDHFSRNHKVGVSLVDVWNAQQAQGNASTSKTETIQEAVGHSAVPLYPVMPDQEGQPLHLTLNDEPDKWSPGVEDTTSPKIHRKESSLFEDSISLSANAIPSIGNSEEDELSDTSPSSDWISTYSSFHSILEDFGTRPELEKSLDEEIMDSIFD